MVFRKINSIEAKTLQSQTLFSLRAFLWSCLLSSAALVLVACGSTTPAVTAEVQPVTEVAPLQQPTPTSPSPARITATAVIQEGSGATETAQTQAWPPIPDCNAEVNPTPPTTEGPYYTADTPERTSLIEPGVIGTKLLLTGYVLSTDCTPIPGAWLDFWQADGNGQYDNTGYRLRGHQFTDEAGRYYLETVVPGLYPGRPPHIHVKIQAPNQPVLTTQLYFPGEVSNQGDSFFFPQLLVTMQDTEQGVMATFNFVLEIQ